MKNLLHVYIGALLLTPSLAIAQMTPTLDDIYIPMSDGDSLQADVYIPASVTNGQVILIQTPYNKDLFEYSLPMGVGTDLDTQPFIWVIVDWRGFYGSSMADVSSVDRGQDGYDVCEWIVAQTWHDDRIGTWGPSALGGIQYQLIDKHHPNHVCAVPLVAHSHQSYDSYFYGGVLEEARLYQLDALGYGLSPVILANVYDSFYWDFAASSTWLAPEIDIPTLQIGGWYDHNIDKMMDFYKSSRNDADASVIDEQWLLVGPWVHGGSGAAYVGSSIQGELTYPNAEFVSDTMAWDFLSYYLLDDPNGWNLTDKITFYEMGGNDQWHTSNADDIAATGSSILYLNSFERLTSAMGNDSSIFISDPNNPSPTIGGANLSSSLDQGPYDQNTLDSRTDILTFESSTLTEDVAVTGRIQLDLWVSADVADCDIAIRLADVYPDGRSMLITDGIKRMRFRSGDYTSAGEEFMVAGEVYNVQVDLPFTNYTWLTGHKIKIYVSGNHDSRFNVNLQDGGAMYTAGTAVVGNISIHHSATYPSKINFPGLNPTLEITENQPEFFHLTLYPNPSNSVVFLSGNEMPIHYQMVDLTGKLIADAPLISNTLNVSEFAKGTYFIRFTFENGQVLDERLIIR